MKNLKKWAFPILLALAIAIGLWWYFKPTTPVNPVQDQTFVEYVIEDYAYAKSFENDSTTVRFYEVETVLNGNLDTLATNDVKVLSSMSVFSVNDTVFFLTRTYGVDTLVIDKQLGKWIGSAPLDSFIIKVQFEDAVKKLYENGKLPAGDKMTFRQPLDGRAEHPMYIFGTQGTFFVGVDSYSGEVAEL